MADSDTLSSSARNVSSCRQTGDTDCASSRSTEKRENRSVLEATIGPCHPAVSPVNLPRSSSLDQACQRLDGRQTGYTDCWHSFSQYSSIKDLRNT
ncbi:hypothetical protein ElyMa_002597800 [Elysia marginata]|uniref:Uncharacterized protein n=1 Tax=Elysia marginata TaxID=1093978 RepID=A0AAV4H298_9GAST|nr:hypothetical protein ElyMa_002597800 [Elysia marginata]